MQKIETFNDEDWTALFARIDALYYNDNNHVSPAKNSDILSENEYVNLMYCRIGNEILTKYIHINEQNGLSNALYIYDNGISFDKQFDSFCNNSMTYERCLLTLLWVINKFETKIDNIAIIGFGKIGKILYQHLVRLKYRVSVIDTRTQKLIARDYDLIITCTNQTKMSNLLIDVDYIVSFNGSYTLMPKKRVFTEHPRQLKNNASHEIKTWSGILDVLPIPKKIKKGSFVYLYGMMLFDFILFKYKTDEKNNHQFGPKAI